MKFLRYRVFTQPGRYSEGKKTEQMACMQGKKPRPTIQVPLG